MSIFDGMKLNIVVSVLAQLYLVFVYLKAKRKRNHVSFTILLLSAALTLVYLTLVSISYFIEIPQEQANNLYRYGLFFGIPAFVTWALGTRSLVKAYVEVAPESPPEPPPPSSPGKWGP